MTRRLRACALACGLAVLFANAPAAVAAPLTSPTPASRPDRPQPDALSLVADAGLSGDFSYIVIDLETGAALEGGDADLPLPPASVAKAPTALYALATLGPGHRFETRLAAVGERADGVLAGDLILQGGGDPELDSADLDLLAFRAMETGLKRVEGRFLVDGELLPQIERIDLTQPEVAGYNPSVGGLNLNFNRVHARWRRSGDGYDTFVEARSDALSPPVDLIALEVVEATANGAVFDYEASEAGERWAVRRGALGKTGARWLPVRRPALYAGSVFRTLAAREGLETPAPEHGAAPLVSDVIARIESRALADILADMLRYSTNLTAEAVGLAATRSGGGRANGGVGDPLEASAGAMGAWAASFADFPAGDPGFQLVNHSGLSGASRVSVRRLAEILVAADKRGFPSLGGGRAATLRGLLPIKRHLDDDRPKPAIEASVRAKTGTLNFVTALAGYIEPEVGRRLVFAMIAADLERRALLTDRNIERPAGSRAWANRARRLQRALLRSWIDRFAAPAG